MATKKKRAIKLIIGRDGYASVFSRGKIQCFLPVAKARQIYNKIRRLDRDGGDAKKGEK